jgi:hypothetical protein
MAALMDVSPSGTMNMNATPFSPERLLSAVGFLPLVCHHVCNRRSMSAMCVKEK